MSSSFEGSGAPSGIERTNLSLVGNAVSPGSIGFQMVAGESVAAIETLRGPVRRSRYCASEVRQVSAACCRSAGVIVTCINFSASSKVAGVTGGPAPGPVPKVGGAPGAVDDDCEFAVDCRLRQAAAATSTP